MSYLKSLALLVILALSLPAQPPQLRKQGTATQFIVDGRPFLVLGGELLNSSSSNLDYMNPIWQRMVDLRINTVLAGVSWELIEPSRRPVRLRISWTGSSTTPAAITSARLPLVRQLEKRHVQLQPALGQAAIQALPDVSGWQGGKTGSPLHSLPRQLGGRRQGLRRA